MKKKVIFFLVMFFMTHTSLFANPIEYNYNFSGTINNLSGGALAELTPDDDYYWLVTDLDEGDAFTGYINATFTLRDDPWPEDYYRASGEWGYTLYGDNDETWEHTYTGDFDQSMNLGSLYSYGDMAEHELRFSPHNSLIATNSGEQAYGYGTIWDYSYIPDMYLFSLSLTGTINEASPVPEPTTLVLFGSGLAGLAGFRRKFNRSR